MNEFIEELLLGVELRVGQKMVRIVEVELYLDEDPYSHHQPEQQFWGRWYFHKMNTQLTPSGFKGGTYKGLDLTLGTETSCVGVLIRSILGDQLVEGPSKVVDFILKETGRGNIEELVQLSSDYPPRCDDQTFPLQLVKTEPRERLIYTGPQVGLTYREDELSQRYFSANLRFTTYPQLTKNKFSLVLSFLIFGDPLTDLLSLIHLEPPTNLESSKISRRELGPDQLRSITQIFGVQERTVHRWWSHFHEGIGFKPEGGTRVPDQCRLYGSLWS